MIKRLAAVTAKWLLQAGAISASDVELYEYGIYSFLFTMCPLGLVLMISVFLNMVIEGILLIIPFILIRKFCGGFHFQSSVLCGIVSTLVLQTKCEQVEGYDERMDFSVEVWYQFEHNGLPPEQEQTM